jgi:hypothetical protein
VRQGWRLGLLCLPRLAQAEPGSAEDPPDVVVHAARASFDDGWLEAEGPLVVEMGAHHLEGEGLRYQPETGLLELRSGTWIFEDQTLRFENAELLLGAQTGTLLQAALESGGFRIQSQELEILDGSRLEGEGVSFTPCSCEPELWGVTAEQVSLVLDEEIRFRKGWLQVCERRILPIPRGRLPLQARKSGFLIPELGMGDDGGRIRVPVFWTLGPHADLLLEPELRTERGARLLAEGRLGLGPTGPLQMGGSAGWDGLEEEWRGHWSGRGGGSDGRLEGAVDALWMSDGDVRQDYEDDYLLRAEPWIEQRAFVGWGPARLETEQRLEDGNQRVLGGVLALPGARQGAFSLDGSSRLDLFADRNNGVLTDPKPRLEGSLGLATGQDLGVLRLEARASAGAVAWQDQEAWGTITAGAAAWLQTWGPGRDTNRLDQWGVVAAASRTSAEHMVLHPWDRPEPDWQLGPALRTRWVSRSGVPVSLGLELPVTPGGLDPSGWFRLQQGAWSARVRGSSELQEAWLSWQDPVWGLGGGMVHDESLWQALGWLSSPPIGPRAALRLGWTGLVDLDERASLSQGPSLGFSSPCDCLELQLSALWSVDRELPVLGLQLDLL